MKRCPTCAAACWDSHRHCPGCGRDLAEVEPTEEDPYLGTTLLGKYRLVELIGAGAMGRVYRADHLTLDTQVAVKLLNPGIASQGQTAKRFHQEARAASRLRHPNTIAILDFGQAENGALFLAMELLRGRTLSEILQKDPVITPRRIVDLLGQALTALDEAHASGVIHRDFKPENIFVEMLRTGNEHVKVLDFGIAKLRGEADTNLTSAGVVCGTPDYMSPEQIRGEELDARSDVYAAGVVLYELLTGSRPFRSSGPVIDVLMAHLKTPPDPPRQRRAEPEISRGLEQVCLRALAKGREERYRSAAELKQALVNAVRDISGERCHRCGTLLPGTARFCPECGAVLRPTGSFVEAASALGASAAISASPSEPPRFPLPLVGRGEVLDRLEGLQREALLIVGGPGIGKTAVASAWKEREEARFRRVIESGPDPSGAAAPWYPIRRVLALLLSLADRPTREELEQATAGHPEDRTGLAELFGLGGVASGLPLNVRRSECVAAALATLRRAEASFLFDDIDGFDGPSRRLLAELMNQPETATVVATALRAEAVDVEVEVLRLQPLDALALEELRLPPGVNDFAQGIPFLIEQALRARAEEAREPTLTARLEKLPPVAAGFVEIAAVGGGDVPSSLLAEAIGMADPGRAIAELALRNWVKGGQHLEMASPTVRKAVYQAIDEERRGEMHARLAALLDGRGSDPIVVAHHAYLSGDISRGTAVALERAGDTAREGFDDDAAARWYRAALERGRQALELGEGDEKTQIRAALKLGLVLRYRGEVVPSETVLREALKLAVARGDQWAEVQARRGLARLALTWEDLEAARDHLIAGVTAGLGGGDAAMLAELYIDLADVLGRLGDFAGAERELWEGVMLCTAGEGPEVERGPEPLWRMLLMLGEFARRARQLKKAHGFGVDALRHVETARSPLARARVHRFLADVHQDLGRGDYAVEHRRSAVDELRRVGDRRSTAELLLELAEPDSSSAAETRAWLHEADLLANQVGWREGVSRSRARLEKLK